MSRARVRALVTGAGTGSSGNLIRALRRIRPRPYIVGINSDRFTIRQSLADRSYLCPAPDGRTFARAAAAVVRQERLNVVLPTDESVVKALSDGRRYFPIDLALPDRATIDLCHDKYALSVRLRRQGVPVPMTYPVRSLGDVARIFSRFRGRARLWCRARRGALTRGATAVASPAQAKTWISLWRDLGGAKVSEFTLAEYLTGRHIMIQSIWRQGTVLAAQAVEVISYFAEGSNPSGIFSMASLSKTVVAPAALDVALRAVRAIQSRPNGAFDVELRERASGEACVTEINAGRFPAGFTVLLAVENPNMVEVFVRSALGQTMSLDAPLGGSEGRYMVRDIDAVPGAYSTGELIKGLTQDAAGSTIRTVLAGTARRGIKVAASRRPASRKRAAAGVAIGRRGH